MFKAIVVDKHDENYTCTYQNLEESQFPDGNVTVRVEFSTLNYKDGLAVTGRSPVVRRFPMVLGIDFAGVVEHSDDPNWSVGQKVFINGWGLGEKYWGGLAQKAKVNGDWLLPIPDGMTAYDVMSVGTAGYTAMLAVNSLQKQGITPKSGSILVTGASGGVGGFSIAFLSKLGFDVIASTGRMDEEVYLKKLGAKEVIDRSTLSGKGRALNKECWVAAIDSVGSHTLANVCSSTQYGGVVAACGLAQGMDFPVTVAPFILRGVTLVGIDSVMCPIEKRREAWKHIAELVDHNLVESMSTLIPFKNAMDFAHAFFDGQKKGRIVVEIPQE